MLNRALTPVHGNARQNMPGILDGIPTLSNHDLDATSAASPYYLDGFRKRVP